MRMLNAWTTELDDAQVAVDEILKQLNLESSLLANAAGFLTCSYDYVETGIVEAVCRALPFDVVGCTTLTNAIEGQLGTMLLCLSVLTADDCTFSAGITGPLVCDLDGEVAQAVGAARARLDAAPGLMLAFLPMLSSFGGELVLGALDKAAGSVPIFGTLACDFDTALYANSFTFHNGRCFSDCAGFLLISGNIQPRFVVMATSEQNLHMQQAVITSSEGSLLKEVNGMSARDYFASIGLIPGGGIDGLSSVPFVVSLGNDTQPVARAIYSLNEDGSAICGGVMPEGGVLSIGRMDVDDILLTAKLSIQTLLDGQAPAGMILFPCLGRNMVLGVNSLAEAELVASILGTSLPWHLAYSGGELCPVGGSCGSANRFHNFTFIGCAI